MKKVFADPAGVIAALFLMVACALATTSTYALAEPFYKGKTVRILVPYSPGGGFDTNARVVARHLPKHIPGEPSMIVQNMPGGGGLVALNYFYSVAKPNGLMLAHLPHLTAFFEVSDVPQVKYKSEEFKWLGSTNSTVGPVVIRHDAPVKDLKELLDPKTPPLIIGASGETGTLSLGPRIVNEIFSRQVFKVVTGYRGTAPIRMAMERDDEGPQVTFAYFLFSDRGELTPPATFSKG